MGVRERLREQAARANKPSGSGDNLNGGAVYVLECKGVKMFSGHKSDQQAVIEWEVKEATPTKVDEKLGKPNAVGSTVSSTFDTAGKDGKYLFGLFLGTLAALTGVPYDDLIKPDPESKEGAQEWEALVQMDFPDLKTGPSPCVGMRVKCDAFWGKNKDKSKDITKTRWETIAA